MLSRSPSDRLKRLDYQAIFEQYARDADRGLIIVGPGRIVLEINPAGRRLLDFADDVPRPIADVVHDMNVEFGVGQAFHDRRPVILESYAPTPDRLLQFRIQ